MGLIKPLGILECVSYTHIVSMGPYKWYSTILTYEILVKLIGLHIEIGRREDNKSEQKVRDVDLQH